MSHMVLISDELEAAEFYTNQRYPFVVGVNLCVNIYMGNDLLCFHPSIFGALLFVVGERKI